MDLTFIKTKHGGIVSIHKSKNSNTFTTNLFNSKWVEINDTDMNEVVDIMISISRRKISDKERRLMYYTNQLMDLYNQKFNRGISIENNTNDIKINQDEYNTLTDKLNNNDNNDNQIELKIEVCENLQNFFNEFEFKPQNRFINTLLHFSKKNNNDCKNYINGYMKLIDKPEKSSINEKMKSPEFRDILNTLSKIKSNRKINNRLELYFGEAGSGKTTTACKKYPNAKITVCNSSMLPSDLLEVFDFNDKNGNPVFKKSDLRIAMEEGRPHILDEIRLLTDDCLSNLQGFLDNKTEFNFKNEIIHIKEGFKIIGTMNLEVNGQIYSLPEALVDRAYLIEEFSCDAKTLATTAF